MGNARAGVVQLNDQTTLKQIKAAFGGAFTPDPFDRMEQKGLFIKRESSHTGSQALSVLLRWQINKSSVETAVIN